MAVALVAVIALTAFVWYKALKASSKRNAAKRELITKLEHEKKLREEYAVLTADKLRSAEPEMLAEGVGTNIQMYLEKQPDMNAAFEALTEPKKYAYAICYIVQDGSKKLSEFFRANGKPLTPVALAAVEEIIGGEYADVFKKEYDIFDDDNETDSFNENEVSRLDEKSAELFAKEKDKFFSDIKEYYISNYTALI